RNYAVEAVSRLTRAPDDPSLLAAVVAAQRDKNASVCFSAGQAERRIRQRIPAGAPLIAEWSQPIDSKRLGALAVGGPAPPFELTSGSGNKVRSRDFHGRKSIVLLFQLDEW